MSSLPQLTEEDVQEFDRSIQDLLFQSEATTGLLLDKGGFLLTQCGETRQFDITTLSALSAASFAATQAVAGLVSETNFSSVYQQGERFSLLVLNVGEWCLLTIIFRASISVGAVKYYAGTTIDHINQQLEKARVRSPETGLDLSLLNLADPKPLFRKKVA